MDNYKLTFMDLQGIAEPIRLIFKYSSVPFEDYRIPVDDWLDHKKSYKWERVPLLEWNGKSLSQSVAISRFLGRKFGLIPDDQWEAAKCDEIVGALYDLRNLMEPMFYAKYNGDNETSEKCRGELLSADKVPLILTNLNDLLKEIKTESGNGGDLIFGGSRPYWADFWLAHFTHRFVEFLEEPSLLENCELLKLQKQAVYNLEKISEYISQRASTFI
ncbi:unnamed protein product [Orchesella dallaii]|uniref:glutathione transferase n=1 Tax=Orchesella dallaii TaxID=48710 RepID=A0ABP1R6P5_9HEXA